PERTDRAGDEHLAARDLPRVTRELDAGLVDPDELVLQVASSQLRPVCAERVGLDQLGAGVDEADVHRDDSVRRADVRLLGAAEPRRGGRDQRAGPAVGGDRWAVAQALEEA